MHINHYVYLMIILTWFWFKKINLFLLFSTVVFLTYILLVYVCSCSCYNQTEEVNHRIIYTRLKIQTVCQNNKNTEFVQSMFQKKKNNNKSGSTDSWYKLRMSHKQLLTMKTCRSRIKIKYSDFTWNFWQIFLCFVLFYFYK